MPDWIQANWKTLSNPRKMGSAAVLITCAGLLYEFWPQISSFFEKKPYCIFGAVHAEAGANVTQFCAGQMIVAVGPTTDRERNEFMHANTKIVRSDLRLLDPTPLNPTAPTVVARTDLSVKEKTSRIAKDNPRPSDKRTPGLPLEIAPRLQHFGEAEKERPESEGDERAPSDPLSPNAYFKDGRFWIRVPFKCERYGNVPMYETCYYSPLSPNGRPILKE
jgi:hypothetical protein